jgi:hypothetical protein
MYHEPRKDNEDTSGEATNATDIAATGQEKKSTGTKESNAKNPGEGVQYEDDNIRESIR